MINRAHVVANELWPSGELVIEPHVSKVADSQEIDTRIGIRKVARDRVEQLGADREYIERRALRLCAKCPALRACRAWLRSLGPDERPAGIVCAGRILDPEHNARTQRSAAANRDRCRMPMARHQFGERGTGERRWYRA